nr:class I adenylate-forming enzyme family protein [uncultured Desulfobacter sp.]
MKNRLQDLTEQAVAGLLNGTGAPDKPFCGQHTYADIRAMAHAILDQCSATGAQQGYLAVFSMDRAVTAAAIVARLAGGPIMVLPHDVSDAALMDLASDPEHTWVVTDPGRTLPSRFKTVVVNGDDNRSNIGPLTAAIDSDAPLLRLYTGGSTGKPTIWTKTVANIMGEALFQVNTHVISQDDVVVATVPPYHIYGLLFSVAAPMLAGARVADQTCGFPHEIINLVKDTAATILISVPAHFRALNGHDFGKHGLRLAFSSAGVLDETDERDFRQRNNIPVMEVYGSTETGGIAFRCRGRDETSFSPFNVIETRIAQETIKIRSPFVSPEILRDELGFYLVPDRVKQCSGNNFAILGRSDTVVKIAGIRVDLDQVLAVLKTMAGVRDALVLTKPVPRGRAFDICALVEGDCTHSDVRQFLAGRLEAVAHPRRIKVVDHMPMTRSGKYDRAAVATLFETNEGETK